MGIDDPELIHKIGELSGASILVSEQSPRPGQTLRPHGPDRNLGVDEISGLRLVEPATSAGA